VRLEYIARPGGGEFEPRSHIIRPNGGICTKPTSEFVLPPEVAYVITDAYERSYTRISALNLKYFLGESHKL